MGYFSEFIEDGSKLIHESHRWLESEASFKDPELRKGVISELTVLNYQIQSMKMSRIVKIPGEQLKLFLDLPLIAGQDYKQLRSPFQYLYIEPINQPVIFEEYYEPLDEKIYRDVQVKGIIVVATLGSSQIDAIFKSSGGLRPEKGLIQMYEVSAHVPLRASNNKGHDRNTYVASFGITPDGELVRAEFADGEDVMATVDGRHFVVERGRSWVKETSEKVVNLVVHTLNYLTSPTVILEEKTVSPELQRARQKRGKEPLPGWYEIQYTKSRVRYQSANPGSGAKHSFRYDVRGHFMNFTRGRLAGRVIWCPPHQRGLQNELYKPKVYRTDKDRELPEQPEIYRG